MSESAQFALQLLTQMYQTVGQLLQLTDEDLKRPVDHTCAMDGGLRRLLIHNAEHERIHAGAISNARFTAKRMQESELARLIGELLRERVEVVRQVLLMDDSLLDAKPEKDEWPVRKHIEHLLYWEKDSMAAVARDLAVTDAQGSGAVAGRRPARRAVKR